MESESNQNNPKPEDQKKEPKKPIEIDGGMFFAVEPKTDCPHLPEEFSQELMDSLQNVEIYAKCKNCTNLGENWVCLTCADVFCSRFVNLHMVDHNAETSHPIALSFSDLSFWCYSCDSYITSPLLQNILNIFTEKKFGNKNVDRKMKETIAKLQRLKISEQEEIKEGDESQEDEKQKDQPTQENAVQNENNEESKKVEAAKDEEEKGLQIIKEKSQEESIDKENVKEEEKKEEKKQPSPQKKELLPELTIECLANHLKNGDFKNVAVLTGAGISVNAGIPDFRSPGTGLYSNLAKYNLPKAESIFDIAYFMENPEPFFQLAKELAPSQKYIPTITHYFIKLLEKKGILKINLTQNIDSLELDAGVSPELVVQAHGSFKTSHCINCNKVVDQEKMQECCNKGVPMKCPTCEGLCKPDIVFFGEALPKSFFIQFSEIAKCNLILIMGTSLVVTPFCFAANMAYPGAAKVLINRTVCSGFREDNKQPEEYKRNLFLQGDCDEVILKIVELAGWKEDFDEILKEREKLIQEKNLSSKL